jgi:hypothetical protein
MRAFKIPVLLAALCVLAGGCGKGSDGAAPEGKTGMHRDVPPHGGTPVPLGDDYNLELVRDGADGTLSAYVLDDEMEDFIRSSSASITITAKSGGAMRTLVLGAVANPATGETVGDTSLFQGQADWLKTTPSFEGSLVSVTVRDTTFAGIAFKFPDNGEPQD